MKIKKILIERTASINYNPNLFIDEILSIIKAVFVKKEGLLANLLKNDKPNQLENMRKEIDERFLDKFEERMTR